ncbi:MAG: CHAD domain-containing protein [Polynucleobacter sp.]
MLNTSRELEVKLLFPAEKLQSIENFIISKGGARRQRLQAAYIDTPDFLLSKSGIAFRIRREGRHWVQTLKVSTANALERIEHNVILDTHGSDIPQWSINLHQEHQAGLLFKQLLPNLSIDDLQIRYQTDIWRRKVDVNTRSGVLEYALDQGVIFANHPDGVRKEQVQELEIELKQGHAADVLRHAQVMVKRFKAYIDTRSKSERGYLLACGVEVSPAKRAETIALKKLHSKQDVVNLLLDACLGQVLSNQSVLSTNHEAYDEHLHQLRVGLRRLKTLLKYLSHFEINLSESGTNALGDIFSKLGQYRDDNYVTETLNPLLISHNGPPIEIGAVTALPHPNSLIRSPIFQLLLLEMMSLGLAPMPEEEVTQKSDKQMSAVKKPIFKILNKTFRFTVDQAAKLSDLEDEAIHTLRKKLKFLRYSLEFFKDICNRERFKPFFKLLTVTLDHLGQFNDICVAISRIELMTASDPRLFFALGWLKAERLRLRGLCEKSLKALFLTKPAW